MDAIKSAFLVLIRPRFVFAKVKEKSGAITLFCLLFLIGMTFIKAFATIPAVKAEAKKAARQSQLLMEKRAEEKGEKGAPLQPLPPEALEGPSSGLLISSSFFESLAMVFGLSISAALILLGVLLFRGTITYLSAFSLLALSFMPYFVRDFLQTTYALGTGKLARQMGLANLIMPKNPELFITRPESAPSPYLIVILSRIDLFVIWSLVLLFLGLVIIAGISQREAALLSVSYWFVALLPFLISTFIGTLFMPGPGMMG